MYIVFQHPILDIRPLIADNLAIAKPNWNRPALGEIVRYTGVLKRRLKGGIELLEGENMCCTTYQALKFPDLNDPKSKILFENGSFVKNKGVCRYLNSNGDFLVKLESVFGNKFENFYLPEIDVSKGLYFKKVLEDSCEIATQIGIQTKEKSTIIESGPLLAKHYLYSTTKGFNSPNKPKKVPEDWWLTAGHPVVLVIFSDNEDLINLPNHTQPIKVYNKEKVELYHYWIIKKGQPETKTWIIKRKDDSDEYFIRQLRLNLLRIHAEKENLRLLLNILADKKNILENCYSKEKLDKYLEKISSKLLRETRYGNEQKYFLDYALEADKFISPSEINSFIENLKGVSNKFLKKKLKDLIVIGTKR
jgi:hypothetical protein